MLIGVNGQRQHAPSPAPPLSMPLVFWGGQKLSFHLALLLLWPAGLKWGCSGQTGGGGCKSTVLEVRQVQGWQNQMGWMMHGSLGAVRRQMGDQLPALKLCACPG